MAAKTNHNGSNYAERAFAEINAVMSKGKKNMFEHISRANKGELFVLHFLAMKDAAVLPSEISAALNASTARISAVLGALEKRGQIERDIDKKNRRNILVTITANGRERAETEIKEIQKNMVSVFNEMGETETAEFIRLTKKFFELSEKYMPCQKE